MRITTIFLIGLLFLPSLCSARVSSGGGTTRIIVQTVIKEIPVNYDGKIKISKKGDTLVIEILADKVQVKAKTISETITK